MKYILFSTDGDLIILTVFLVREKNNYNPILVRKNLKAMLFT